MRQPETEAHPLHTNGAESLRLHTSGVNRGQMLVQRTRLQLAHRFVEHMLHTPLRSQVLTWAHRRTIIVGVER